MHGERAVGGGGGEAECSSAAEGFEAARASTPMLLQRQRPSAAPILMPMRPQSAEGDEPQTLSCRDLIGCVSLDGSPCRTSSKAESPSGAASAGPPAVPSPICALAAGGSSCGNVSRAQILVEDGVS